MSMKMSMDGKTNNRFGLFPVKTTNYEPGRLSLGARRQ
jgi:hypothetical protein